MASRYLNREIVLNASRQYKNVFRDRGVNFIRQFPTPKMKYPTPEEINDLQTVGHIWGMGDRFWKLAEKYYGDPTAWFLIAHYNQKPTESHIENGETIFIPIPFETAMRVMGF